MQMRCSNSVLYLQQRLADGHMLTSSELQILIGAAHVGANDVTSIEGLQQKLAHGHMLTASELERLMHANSAGRDESTELMLESTGTSNDGKKKKKAPPVPVQGKKGASSKKGRGK